MIPILVLHVNSKSYTMSKMTKLKMLNTLISKWAGNERGFKVHWECTCLKGWQFMNWRVYNCTEGTLLHGFQATHFQRFTRHPSLSSQSKAVTSTKHKRKWHMGKHKTSPNWGSRLSSDVFCPKTNLNHCCSGWLILNNTQATIHCTVINRPTLLCKKK